MTRAMKKSAALALAAGLVFGGSAGIAVAPAAFAQEGEQPEAGATSYSLTIQKRDLQGGKPIEANDAIIGGDDSTVPGENLGAGFEFKVEKVEPANGSESKNASAAQPVEPTVEYTGTTNASGQITLTNLEAGVYRVTETKVPADSGYVPGPAFLVAVPTTNEAGTGTINDVHVYPKNTKADITKTVEDKDVHGGGNYTYNLASDIPAALEGEKLKSYRVMDTLDPKLEAVKPENIEVRVGTDWDNAKPVDSSNYTLTPGESQSGHEVKIEFNEIGLRFLTSQAQGAKVLTRITAKAPSNEPVIPNKAKLYFNSGEGEGEIERESEEVKTYWGSLKINKTGNENAPLQGAEFRLVKCQADGNSYKMSGDTPLTINGEKSWTTGTDGSVTISGIHATDFANNAEDTGTQLCAQETKAPAGFQKDDTLIPFLIAATGSAQREGDKFTSANGTRSYEINFKNEPGERFLPNTGGMGITLLILVGLGIIGGGVYAARRNSA